LLLLLVLLRMLLGPPGLRILMRQLPFLSHGHARAATCYHRMEVRFVAREGGRSTFFFFFNPFNPDRGSVIGREHRC
jgi:hypothetical protein